MNLTLNRAPCLGGSYSGSVWFGFAHSEQERTKLSLQVCKMLAILRRIPPLRPPPSSAIGIRISSVCGNSTSSPGRTLTFDDANAAFKFKTTWDLARAIGILKICSVDSFVDHSLKVIKTILKNMNIFYIFPANSPQVMRTCERILGPRLFSSLLLRPTFYAQVKPNIIFLSESHIFFYYFSF